MKLKYSMCGNFTRLNCRNGIQQRIFQSHPQGNRRYFFCFYKFPCSLPAAQYFWNNHQTLLTP